jgi:hypothetical protein
MIHLYALVRGLAALPPRGGIDGAGLRAVPIEDVIAVVGDDPPETSDREAPLEHGLAVEALTECADAVLPVRFGERFADDDALVAKISPRLGELRSRLKAVEGCVELGVCLAEPREPASGRAANGTEYMRLKLEERRLTEGLVSALHEPLDRRAHASVRRRPVGGFAHDAAYLVARDDAAIFRSIVDRFGAAHPEVTVVCTGPWAPYTFAEPETRS